MLSVQWEELTRHLGRISSVTEKYAQSDPRYIPSVLAWLTELEVLLQRLRRPEAGLVGAERAKVLAAMDGLRPQSVLEAGTSSRKAERILAAQALSAAEGAVRAHLLDVERRLDEHRRSIAQLLAVSSQLKPIPMPPTEPRSEWLKKVWNDLTLSSDIRTMYAYLNGSLSIVDRLYLLDEVITNLTS